MTTQPTSRSPTLGRPGCIARVMFTDANGRSQTELVAASSRDDIVSAVQQAGFILNGVSPVEASFLQDQVAVRQVQVLGAVTLTSGALKCRQCGYSLEGLVITNGGAACPECGTRTGIRTATAGAAPFESVRQPADAAVRIVKLCLIIVVVLIILALAAL